MADINNMGAVDNLIDIQGVATTLSERERVVLHLWVNGHTQAEIGGSIGVNQQRVSVILGKCIVKIRYNCVLS